MTRPFRTIDGMRFSPLEVAVLRAYAKTGSYKDAARITGHSINTVRAALSRMHRKVGVDSTVVLLYRYPELVRAA